MYYRLIERLVLRGWYRLPYAVQDTKSGQTIFLDEHQFRTLSFCNGQIDFDGVLVLPIHRKIVEKFEKQGVVIPCEKGVELRDYQKYRLAKSRYMECAHWSITGKCNMHCRHCYMSAPQAKYGELSNEICMDIIEQLDRANIGTVNLTGGEPLVRKDFLELVDALCEKHIYIAQIYTNGALVNQKLLDELTQRGLKPEFSLSFDGIGWHDWLRGTSGAEEQAITAIKLLRANGFNVSVESAFHSKSIHTLWPTLLLLAELGVGSCKINPVSDSGNWINEDDSFRISKEELYHAYLDVIPRFLAANSPLSLMLGGFFRCRKGSKEYSIPCKKFSGKADCLHAAMCGSARTTMYIAADGKLLPCIPMSGLPIQDIMPSILDTSLEQALFDSVYLKYIDTRLEKFFVVNERCAVCEHRLVCGGGCRAGALIATGEYLGYDDYTCFFFQNGYEAKIEAAIKNSM